MKKVFLVLSAALSLFSCSLGLVDSSESTELTSGTSRALAPLVQLSYAQSRLINLGHAVLIGQVNGSIEVENVSPSKDVLVHYTLDGTNWTDVKAYFLKALPGNREEWSFGIEAYSIPYVSVAPSVAVRFAVKMTAGSLSWWDNNGGKDFFVSTRGTGEVYPVVALGKKNIRLEGAHYGSVYPAGTVLDLTASVKNLAYAKDVKLVYTKDDWKTVKTANLLWVKNYSATAEQWKSSIVIDAYDPLASNNTWTEEVKFCLAYNVTGTTYWDNADGSNYSITTGYTIE